MRLGRERPRKLFDPPLCDVTLTGFNEAGARTPQKVRQRERAARVIHVELQ